MSVRSSHRQLLLLAYHSSLGQAFTGNVSNESLNVYTMAKLGVVPNQIVMSLVAFLLTDSK